MSESPLQDPPAIRRVVAPAARGGESPVWDERRGEIVMVDTPARAIWAVDPLTGRVAVHPMQSRPGSVGLCASGRWIVALEREVAIYDPRTRTATPLCRPDPGAVRGDNRLNDGKVGPDGAFYVGSMNQTKPRASTAALYRVAPDGGVRELRAGLFTSNGLAFSRDGRIMLHSDSKGQWIERRAFDPASGPVGEPQPFATADDAQGRPDGGALDAAGVYWSAGVSAGVLNAYGPDGALLRRWRLPVASPSMPCFGGGGFATLFLTSLSDDLPQDRRRPEWDGALMAMAAESPGFATFRFADEA